MTWIGWLLVVMAGCMGLGKGKSYPCALESYCFVQSGEGDTKAPNGGAGPNGSGKGEDSADDDAKVKKRNHRDTEKAREALEKALKKLEDEEEAEQTNDSEEEDEVSRAESDAIQDYKRTGRFSRESLLRVKHARQQKALKQLTDIIKGEKGGEEEKEPDKKGKEQTQRRKLTDKEARERLEALLRELRARLDSDPFELPAPSEEPPDLEKQALQLLKDGKDVPPEILLKILHKREQKWLQDILGLLKGKDNSRSGVLEDE